MGLMQLPLSYHFTMTTLINIPQGWKSIAPKGKQEAQRNDRQLYETANNACHSFIMTVVDETWYKELKDPDTFYTKMTAIKLLEHLT